ncbi:AAA family ATPase [Thiomicrospira sp. S5]|nr:AAA family ATPase [Thiomicrospira sp. S5]
MNETGTLIFFSGKMGAGKSAYAKQLANELKAILLSEDEWLAALS